MKYLCKKLNELQNHIIKVGDFSNHPWLYRKADTILTSSFMQLISDLSHIPQ